MKWKEFLKNWKKPPLYIVAVVAVALIVVFLILFLGREEAPPVISLTSPDAGGDLSASAVPGSVLTADVSRDTVQAVISTLSRTDSYYRKLTATSYEGDGARVRELEVWCKGTNIKISLKTGSEVKNALITGADLYIWYDGEQRAYKGSASDTAADEFSGMISYEDIISLNPDAIIDAGHVEYKGESCVFVEYSWGELGYTQRAYISIDTGLLMGDEVWDGETLIYSVVSDTPDITTPADAVFELPPNLAVS